MAIDSGASNNTVGGTSRCATSSPATSTTASRSWDSGTTGNVVVGNFIGTAASGSRALPNGGSSSRTSYDQVSGDVVISGGASGNGTGWVWVGTDGQGTAGGEPGLLAGNTTIGIQLSEEGTNGNIVQGNLIGGLAGGELNFYFTSAESEAQDGLGLAAPIGGLGSGFAATALAGAERECPPDCSARRSERLSVPTWSRHS